MFGIGRDGHCADAGWLTGWLLLVVVW